METIKITKKQLKEQVREQVFTGRGYTVNAMHFTGKYKIHVLWFDWAEGEYVEDGVTKRFCGAKYMVAVVGSKKAAFERMYNWLTNGFVGYHPEAKQWVAQTDAHRKKMPLQFNWNAY